MENTYIQKYMKPELKLIPYIQTSFKRTMHDPFENIYIFKNSSFAQRHECITVESF